MYTSLVFLTRTQNSLHDGSFSYLSILYMASPLDLDVVLLDDDTIRNNEYTTLYIKHPWIHWRIGLYTYMVLNGHYLDALNPYVQQQGVSVW